LAGGTPALAPALRANLQLLAEFGRAILCADHRPSHPPRFVPFGHDLVQRIDHLVANHNIDCKPFIWTATTDSILAKLQRLSIRISGTAH
jgi:hypothetical protein